jgi:hypothetical protein
LYARLLLKAMKGLVANMFVWNAVMIGYVLRKRLEKQQTSLFNQYLVVLSILNMVFLGVDIWNLTFYKITSLLIMLVSAFACMIGARWYFSEPRIRNGGKCFK